MTFTHARLPPRQLPWVAFAGAAQTRNLAPDRLTSPELELRVGIVRVWMIDQESGRGHV